MFIKSRAGSIVAIAFLSLAAVLWWQHRRVPEDEQGTLLANAVAARKHSQIRELLARGANPNAKGPDGKTVLAMARNLKDSEIISLLEGAGATEGQDPRPGTRGLVAHVLSQRWIVLKESDTLEVRGEKRRVSQLGQGDMAFVLFTFRVKNLSSKPVEIPVFAMLTGESGVKLSDVSVLNLKRNEAGIEPLIGIGPGRERVLQAESVLSSGLAELKRNQPVFIRFLDYDPEGKTTIPAADITLFRWKTLEIDP